MSHKIYSHSDGILKMGFIGDVDKTVADAFGEHLTEALKDYTVEQPLALLVDSSQEGHISIEGRQFITKVNSDKRIHKIAVINIKRVTRVIATFIMKATGRNNIKFFDDESNARQWLKE